MLAALFQPLRVRHLSTRRQPAHPGPVRALSEVNGNPQLARGDGQAADVVLVLVGDQNRVQRGGVFPGQLHAAEKLAATESGIHQDAGTAARHNCAVALGSRRQHSKTNHSVRIPRVPVERPAAGLTAREPMLEVERAIEVGAQKNLQLPRVQRYPRMRTIRFPSSRCTRSLLEVLQHVDKANAAFLSVLIGFFAATVLSPSFSRASCGQKCASPHSISSRYRLGSPGSRA